MRADTRNYVVSKAIGLLLAVLVLCPGRSRAATEATFDVLEVGTQTYRNVTVTTKAKAYIFILHSSGMASIKVADLPSDARVKLGYETEKPKPRPAEPPPLVQKVVAKVETPGVKSFEKNMVELGRQFWRQHVPNTFPTATVLRPDFILIILAILLVLHISFCYCCSLICRKAGAPPGLLVWLPVFLLLPLLRAAKMSRWWFVICCLPPLSLLAQVLWSVRIAEARGKSIWIALLLIVPVTAPFAFLYLAFSSGGLAVEAQRGSSTMALNAA